MYFYLYTILAIICEITAQYLFKLKNIKCSKLLYVIIGIILYAFTGFFAYKLLKYETLAIANVIWHILHFTIIFIISIYVLNEKLDYQQIIALILGLASIFLFITSKNGNHH